MDATPLLRLYARRRMARLSRQDAVAEQERQLRALLAQARDTRFGRDHGFADIENVEAFQARVRLRRYEDFWTDYWQEPFPVLQDVTWPGRIPYFAATSGTTTGVTKYIPVSRQMVAANKRAALDILVHHLANRPTSRVLAGRNLILGGSTALVEQAPGIFSGDLSGIAARETPFWAKPFTFPPPDLALLSDWTVKMERIGRASLREDIRSISGTPSWMLLYLDRLPELAGRPDACLADLHPDLEMIVHGGMSFSPYRTAYERILAGSRAETREVYPASEGFIAVADSGPDEGLRMIVDNGLFYEFVPVEELDSPQPRRFWLGDAEIGVNYALALTSCAGAFAYVLGDTVRLVERDPPRLFVTGRTSYTLSAFGEHLIGEEIERAVGDAAAALDLLVTDYSVGAVRAERPGALGHHLYVVEFADGVPQPERIEAFARRLDERLSALNADYRDHRGDDGIGMDRPVIQPVPPGTFAAWMRARGRLGGQNKVPRVINDAELFDDLRGFADASRPPGA